MRSLLSSWEEGEKRLPSAAPGNRGSSVTRKEESACGNQGCSNRGVYWQTERTDFFLCPKTRWLKGLRIRLDHRRPRRWKVGGITQTTRGGTLKKIPNSQLAL